MSNALTTLSQSLAITLPVGKAGKISRNVQVAGNLIRENKASLLSVALHGRGAMASVARATLQDVAPSLSVFLSRDSIDGSEWGNLLAQLVAEVGMVDFNQATMSGKAGCAEYAQLAVTAAQLAFARADTVKGQERAISRIEYVEGVQANVTRLIEAAEQARRDAMIDAAEAAAELEQTISDADSMARTDAQMA